MQATTEWHKWTKDGPGTPLNGEWCLWSMVIRGERSYFSGWLFESNGKVLLALDSHAVLIPDDSVYFARVNRLPEKIKATVGGDPADTWRFCQCE